MPHWSYHVHIQNDMENAVVGLNLHAIWEQLEDGQEDIVNLDPGESIEFRCNDPMEHLISKRFRTEVERVGGTTGDVWMLPVEDLPLPPQE
jgi:hypothetical protein